MAIMVGTHSPNLQTWEHDLTITLRCPEIKQTDGGMKSAVCHRWSGLKVQRSKYDYSILCQYKPKITPKSPGNQTSGGVSQLFAIAA